MEHLLFYGADMSSQNASGNTALHLCALYNQVRRPAGGSELLVLVPTLKLLLLLQDGCARVLLFRGADKDVKNYNNQTAFQVHNQNQSRTRAEPEQNLQ